MNNAITAPAPTAPSAPVVGDVVVYAGSIDEAHGMVLRVTRVWIDRNGATRLNLGRVYTDRFKCGELVDVLCDVRAASVRPAGA